MQVTKSIKVKCRHCKKRQGKLQERSLCHTCYRTPYIRPLYPTKRETKKSLNDTTTSVYQRIQQAWDHHPLWNPSSLPSTDPRYNELVEARKAAGLPERHPQDAKPDLS